MGDCGRIREIPALGNARNIAFWVVLLILVMALFQLFSGNQATMSSRSLTYSDFVERVDAGQVSKVTLDGEKIVVVGKDGNSYVTIKPPGDIVTDNLSRDLIAKGVEVEAEPQAQSGFVSILLSFLPFILLIGVWRGEVLLAAPLVGVSAGWQVRLQRAFTFSR